MDKVLSNPPKNISSKHILLVDDDPLILSTLQKILNSENIPSIGYTDPLKALDSLREYKHSVVICDLFMPQMGGEEFLKIALEIQPYAILLILSGHQDVSSATRLIRKGAYDYLIKPLDPKDLIFYVSRSFEIFDLRKHERLTEIEKKIRIETQLNWNLYKESIIRKSSDKKDSNIIGNLNAGLIQGAGIGNIITLATLIKSSASIQDDQYMISKDIMDIFFQSAENASKVLDVLSEVEYIIDNEIPLTKISLPDFQETIHMEVDGLYHFQRINNNHMRVGRNNSLPSKKYVLINQEYFTKALKEILVNAMKFSIFGSTIYVLFELNDKFIKVSTLNSPELSNGKSHILEEDYQSIVFEPFIRFSDHTDERYNSFNLGIGLTLVEKIITRHNGKIYISSLKNFLSTETSGKLISMSFEIPIVES
ncbi:MAG: response regulator [Leptospiraceae bacterium]|nr:response regulator [Leptospiraceae bacterium]MCP5512919.1 response regulator [Leptospiraceae bacterium]